MVPKSNFYDIFKEIEFVIEQSVVTLHDILHCFEFKIESRNGKLYVYVSVHVHMCVYVICVCVCRVMYVCVSCMYVCVMYVCVVCMCVSCMYVCVMYVCVCAMYVCVCAMYVCVCVCHVCVMYLCVCHVRMYVCMCTQRFNMTYQRQIWSPATSPTPAIVEFVWTIWRRWLRWKFKLFSYLSSWEKMFQEFYTISAIEDSQDEVNFYHKSQFYSFSERSISFQELAIHFKKYRRCWTLFSLGA